MFLITNYNILFLHFLTTIMYLSLFCLLLCLYSTFYFATIFFYQPTFGFNYNNRFPAMFFILWFHLSTHLLMFSIPSTSMYSIMFPDYFFYFVSICTLLIHHFCVCLFTITITCFVSTMVLCYFRFQYNDIFQVCEVKRREVPTIIHDNMVASCWTAICVCVCSWRYES